MYGEQGTVQVGATEYVQRVAPNTGADAGPHFGGASLNSARTYSAGVGMVERRTEPPQTPSASATQHGGRSPERLRDAYERWFHVELADTPDRRDEAFRLRYQVYVVEHPFEDPDDHPDGVERDAYDDFSAHSLLIYRPTGVVAGTVRLVLPRADAPQSSFPIQEVCTDPLIADPGRFPVPRMGEISRFCVSKQFRRRQTDTLFPDALDEGIGRPANPDEARRMMSNITLGLMEAIVRMCVVNRATYLCAVMERQLLRLLSRMGIFFDPVGPVVEFHGRRQPCFRHLPTLLAQVRDEHEDVWEILTNDGAHIDALAQIEAAYD